MSHWSFAASTSVIVIGLAVWLAAGWLCLLHWRSGAGRKAVVQLEGLRLFIITLLVFTLLRPEFVQQLSRTEKPGIAVLCDASGSMKTRDVTATNGVVTRAEWLAQQREARFWKPLEQSARVTVEDFAAAAAESPVRSSGLGRSGPPEGGTPTTAGRAATDSAIPTEPGTDLNRALEDVLRRQRNLKAVLLLSDGDWNFGQSPVVAATRYREQDVPIFAVAVGREAPLPDLALESVSVPAYGLFGEQIVIPFKIRSHLPGEVKTAVTLFDPTGEETKKAIVIPALGELQESILWSPRAVGETTLRLQLPVQKEEAIPDNNQQAFHINIRIDKLKVLVVDSLPRWEYRYLRNALERDPGVEMHCLLFHPGLAMGGGRNYLGTFPRTKEALSQYDVIFLGDVGIGQNELSNNDAELIRGLVEQQASGLVLLPGARGRQLTLIDSPLSDLLPVVLDKTKPGGIGLQNESNLQLSSEGRRHWLTRFDADEDRNEEIWKQLPGFYWSAGVEKSRPGSEVLAVHSSLRNSWGRVPLLVTRAAGNGKVLFMGTDSAWRWRRGVEDKFHYRFWGQVVRWMAHQRHLAEKEGVRLTYSPETPQVGDTIFLQATVLDAAGLPLADGQVTGKIAAPSKRSERLAFAPVEGGWGVFKSSFTPQEGGRYKVQVAAEKHGRTLDTEILIMQPQREKLGQPVNAEILREIAGLTRAASASYEALDQIVKQISLLPEPKPIEKRVRLWASPWWGGAILLLLAIYWIGRKLTGMV